MSEGGAALYVLLLSDARGDASVQLLVAFHDRERVFTLLVLLGFVEFCELSFPTGGRRKSTSLSRCLWLARLQGGGCTDEAEKADGTPANH